MFKSKTPVLFAAFMPKSVVCWLAMPAFDPPVTQRDARKRHPFFILMYAISIFTFEMLCAKIDFDNIQFNSFEGIDISR